MTEPTPQIPAPTSARAWMREHVDSTFTRADFDAFIGRLVESIGADVPELTADPELRRDLTAAVRSQFRLFLATPVGAVRGAAHVSPEAHALARAIARRGLDLRVVSGFDHACHRAVLAFASEFVRAQGPQVTFGLDLMTMMWEQTSELMNTLLEEMSATHTAEREGLLRGAFSQRIDTVRELLDGTETDAAAASRRMAYPLHRTHVGLVVWAEDDGHDLESVALRLARALGGTDALCVPSGSRGVWGWLVTDGSASDARVRAVPVPAGVRVAIGEPGAGVDGFRRTHREALAARALADRGTVDRGRLRAAATRYRDVELLWLLSHDPAARSAFVARELSGLLGADESARRLRETLREVLACWGNQEAAARRLGVHKNTVRNRIGRVEQLLGRDLTAHRLSLALALECFDAFGV